MTLRPRFFPLALALGLSCPVVASPQPGDDADDRELARLTSERVVRENCLICHSAELVTASRLTPKQWKAEVEKMVGWGAPLPKEQQEPLVAYLAAEYPASAPPARPATLSYREAAGQ